MFVCSVYCVNIQKNNTVLLKFTRTFYIYVVLVIMIVISVDGGLIVIFILRALLRRLFLGLSSFSIIRATQKYLLSCTDL